MIFLDTNVFVYANITDYSEHQACLQKLQEKIRSDELAINLVVLLESFHILHQHRLGFDDIIYRIEGLMRSRRVSFLEADRGIFRIAMDISKQHDLKINDAIICACMKENNIDRILTTNEKDFKKLLWITVESPLKPK